MKVTHARFLRSADRPESWPAPPRPEVAIAGRSNVGKSSLINTLLGRRGLARTSGKPGHTRSLNFIDVGLDAGGRLHRLRFCDLPGYGFARVSKAERARWKQRIEAYLIRRETLALVVSIVDARHPPTAQDAQMIDWLTALGRPYQVVATKLDKVPATRRVAALRALEEALELPRGHVVGFSAVSGEGKARLWSRILERCAAGE